MAYTLKGRRGKKKKSKKVSKINFKGGRVK